MRKAATIFLILLLAVCAVGCIRSKGSYRTTACISNQTSDSFYMEYESLKGHKTYYFTAPDDTVLNVRFVTKGGKLSCKITDKSGKEYYVSDDVGNEELTIKLGEKSEYSVALQTDGHQGGFYFSW